MGALIEKLQKDTEEIKTLQGIIPICTSCKNIRDGKGNWNHIEAYTRPLGIFRIDLTWFHKRAKKFIWNLFNN